MNVYMKEKTRVFCQNSFDDLDDNIGIVMPILTECDVDETTWALLPASLRVLLINA